MKKIFLFALAAIVSVGLSAQTFSILPADDAQMVFSVKITSPMGTHGSEIIRTLTQSDSTGAVLGIQITGAKRIKGYPEQMRLVRRGNDYIHPIQEDLSRILSEVGNHFEISNNRGVINYPVEMDEHSTFELPSATIKVTMAGLPLTFTYEYLERRIKGIETLETPAGSFECLVLEERTRLQVMGQKQETLKTTWISKDKGMVKFTSDFAGILQTEIVLNEVRGW